MRKRRRSRQTFLCSIADGRRFRWRDLGIGFEHWQMKEPARTSRFSAEEAWHAYLCRNKFWPRFIRIGVLFALYFFVLLHIYQAFSATARSRSRRDRFLVRYGCFFSDCSRLMLLSFYVVDAIQLNSNFIRMFGREVTKWSSERGRAISPQTAANRKGTFCLSRNLFCRTADAGGRAADLVPAYRSDLDDCRSAILF